MRKQIVPRGADLGTSCVVISFLFVLCLGLAAEHSGTTGSTGSDCRHFASAQ